MSAETPQDATAQRFESTEAAAQALRKMLPGVLLIPQLRRVTAYAPLQDGDHASLDLVEDSVDHGHGEGRSDRFGFCPGLSRILALVSAGATTHDAVRQVIGEQVVGLM